MQNEPTRHTLLIADDRPEIRRMLRIRLELEPDLGVVGEAANGAEAVGLAHARQPHAIVLDRDMPVMTGDEAIPLLRAAVPGIAIVIYTADEIIDVDAGHVPDAVVDKAGSLEDLVHEVRRVLGRDARPPTTVDSFWLPEL